ncbi:hypothetical protein BCR33DRAFT_156962 [Rhizoclosmatium globosum]|uniref:Uncharacterized protein n=1 Tax=Rhizoclosmatium globosum TaxID=329046 RepID=A0A1Y2CGE2_9FUNG|nr:hypothetical protein BCR33DRAFT_156962 [Rhizoclosmatium globosum]|eukprot:ORY45977.1 hypothetical protein BCR33DRAFT_156962 [Rhizoclosmatium globosum]
MVTLQLLFQKALFRGYGCLTACRKQCPCSQDSSAGDIRAWLPVTENSISKLISESAKLKHQRCFIAGL